ncbi:uncharacterized protein BDZ99DRAFT_521688 [Mytilinidion resinicola]|uniref:Protein kinase domain-containing protein n=1 Tax=Mytilinidion resinicola TaxID=574789 RepID=A0A6A6YK47_9PEZI|nr:uncharacterized protein BDZ99DRAFT_521688 [Mytilinidion resinicola]KAF2809246.1 hypothetical protein BDZ99DRAFT_521688 [Mytilinidion resinicola]
MPRKPFPLLAGQVPASREERSFEPETHPQNESLPTKLEECLNDGSFPSLLLVHDTSRCTSIEAVKPLSNTTKSSPTNALYSHYTGVLKGQENQTTVAPEDLEAPKHYRGGALTLSFRNLVGVSGHGAVYRASLRLPDVVDVNGRSKTGEVAVIAKLNYLVSHNSENNAQMLKKEATILGGSLKMSELQQEACLCLSHSKSRDAVTMLHHKGHCNPHLVMQPAVPKFYGYYCGQSLETHMKANSKKRVPVNEIRALYERLHDAHFMHGSVYPRNIAIQPGPLSSPPTDRSMNTPSFRIIDLGRARHKSDYKDQSMFRA